MNDNGIQKFELSDGTFIRYSSKGSGPPLILLHTIRNRLEYSNFLVPDLSKKYLVYSVDLPGFGDSPINIKTTYNQEFFTETIVKFINSLKLKEVSLVVSPSP